MMKSRLKTLYPTKITKRLVPKPDEPQPVTSPALANNINDFREQIVKFPQSMSCRELDRYEKSETRQAVVTEQYGLSRVSSPKKSTLVYPCKNDSIQSELKRSKMVSPPASKEIRTETPKIETYQNPSSLQSTEQPNKSLRVYQQFIPKQFQGQINKPRNGLNKSSDHLSKEIQAKQLQLTPSAESHKKQYPNFIKKEYKPIEQMNERIPIHWQQSERLLKTYNQQIETGEAQRHESCKQAQKINFRDVTEKQKRIEVLERLGKQKEEKVKELESMLETQKLRCHRIERMWGEQKNKIDQLTSQCSAAEANKMVAYETIADLTKKVTLITQLREQESEKSQKTTNLLANALKKNEEAVQTHILTISELKTQLSDKESSQTLLTEKLQKLHTELTKINQNHEEQALRMKSRQKQLKLELQEVRKQEQSKIRQFLDKIDNYLHKIRTIQTEKQSLLRNLQQSQQEIICKDILVEQLTHKIKQNETHAKQHSQMLLRQISCCQVSNIILNEQVSEAMKQVFNIKLKYWSLLSTAQSDPDKKRKQSSKDNFNRIMNILNSEFVESEQVTNKENAMLIKTGFSIQVKEDTKSNKKEKVQHKSIGFMFPQEAAIYKPIQYPNNEYELNIIQLNETKLQKPSKTIQNAIDQHIRIPQLSINHSLIPNRDIEIASDLDEIDNQQMGELEPIAINCIQVPNVRIDGVQRMEAGSGEMGNQRLHRITSDQGKTDYGLSSSVVMTDRRFSFDFQSMLKKSLRMSQDLQLKKSGFNWRQELSEKQFIIDQMGDYIEQYKEMIKGLRERVTQIEMYEKNYLQILEICGHDCMNTKQSVRHQNLIKFLNSITKKIKILMQEVENMEKEQHQARRGNESLAEANKKLRAELKRRDRVIERTYRLNEQLQAQLSDEQIKSDKLQIEVDEADNILFGVTEQIILGSINHLNQKYQIQYMSELKDAEVAALDHTDCCGKCSPESPNVTSLRALELELEQKFQDEPFVSSAASIDKLCDQDFRIEEESSSSFSSESSSSVEFSEGDRQSESIQECPSTKEGRESGGGESEEVQEGRVQEGRQSMEIKGCRESEETQQSMESEETRDCQESQQIQENKSDGYSQKCKENESQGGSLSGLIGQGQSTSENGDSPDCEDYQKSRENEGSGGNRGSEVSEGGENSRDYIESDSGDCIESEDSRDSQQMQLNPKNILKVTEVNSDPQ